MRRVLAASALFALALVPQAAAAQNANCAGQPTSTQDACEKATDLYLYMMPQLGTSLVGGSHTLGVGTTLGGFPHFAIALRGNAVMGHLPDVGAMNVGIGGRTSSNIDANSQILGLPGVDFALGVTRVGGVDLIGSVTYIPDIEGDGVTIATDGGSTKIGIGARVGLLEQSLIVPGVSFSYLVRDLPTVNLDATAGNANFTISDFSVKTKSWRLAAQKNLLLFQLGLGVGQDTYESGADITVSGVGAMNTTVAQEVTRTTMYGSVGFNLLIAKIVAEVGQVSGGDIATYNTFSEAADKSRLYGSVGLRISF
jgi:hypothetical protein